MHPFGLTYLVPQILTGGVHPAVIPSGEVIIDYLLFCDLHAQREFMAVSQGRLIEVVL